VRVLNKSFVMGFGRQGRGGSTSRQESNESSKKESNLKLAETDVSADEIQSSQDGGQVFEGASQQHESDLGTLKAPRLLNKISEEKIRALGFMSKLKYVTEPELIDKYIEAEARRREWFESKGWDFTPNVDPKRLPLLSYDTVADIWGQTTLRMEATDASADWEKKSKGNRPLSDAERLRLNDLEKEVARLKKEYAQLLKAAKPNNPSTRASAIGNTGCFKCGKEGHRADQCPDNKPAPTKTAPATPRTAGAKSAGQSGKKVSFSKLQLDTAVQEAVKNTAHETVAAMEKKGWQKP
jgi:hypothetical protein